jgi:hypothetical protein
VNDRRKDLLADTTRLYRHCGTAHEGRGTNKQLHSPSKWGCDDVLVVYDIPKATVTMTAELDDPLRSTLSANSAPLRVCSPAAPPRWLTPVVRPPYALPFFCSFIAAMRYAVVSIFSLTLTAPPARAQSFRSRLNNCDVPVDGRWFYESKNPSSLLTHRFTLLPSPGHLLVLVLLAHPGQTGLSSLLFRGRCRPRGRGRFVVPSPLVERSCLRRNGRFGGDRWGFWSCSEGRGEGRGFGWCSSRLSKWF